MDRHESILALRYAEINQSSAERPGSTTANAAGLRISNGFSATYVACRTDGERSSIIFDHGSRLFEFCSMQAVSISYPKPSGLGMVSIFETSTARTLFTGLSRNDACRFRAHGSQYGQTGCRTGPVGFCIDAAIRAARHASSCIANSNSVSVGSC